MHSRHVLGRHVLLLLARQIGDAAVTSCARRRPHARLSPAARHPRLHARSCARSRAGAGARCSERRSWRRRTRQAPPRRRDGPPRLRGMSKAPRKGLSQTRWIAARARAAPTRARALISFMQPSKSVSMESTSAPLAMGCTSCARLILSAGRNTMDGMPAAAQYADSAADVSPGRACRPGCRAARPEQQGWPTAILGHIHKHRTRLASLPERAPLPVATSSAGRSPAGPPRSGCEACACAPVPHRPANQTGADCAALTSTSACLSAQSQAGALDPARKGERKREPVHPPFAAVHGRSPAGAHRWTRSRRPGRPQAEAGAGG